MLFYHLFAQTSTATFTSNNNNVFDGCNDTTHRTNSD